MTTIKPVTIPREVADAIEYLRDSSGGGPSWTNEQITALYTNNERFSPYHDEACSLREIPFDTLMRALLDGYERELTEEEVREKSYADIRSMYDYHENEAFEDYSGGYCDGVECTLSTLGIVIPGINDAEGGAA